MVSPKLGNTKTARNQIVLKKTKKLCRANSTVLPKRCRPHPTGIVP